MFRLFPTSRAIPAAALAALLLTQPASAQTAASQYKTLQTREDAVRATASPALASVRRLAVAYQDIVRRWPRSGYADNALWQAAGLLQLAAEHGGTTRDRESAVRLLRLLKSEYPTSSLVSQADT